jgi:hypothetical protein
LAAAAVFSLYSPTLRMMSLIVPGSWWTLQACSASRFGQQPCLICGRKPADAHHLRFTQHRALGRKVSDEFTVPLCRGHHREVHRCGDEAAWWKNAGVDPTITARSLWLETHPLPTRLDEMGIAGATSLPPINAKHDRSLSKRGRNYKTKPIIATGPQ